MTGASFDLFLAHNSDDKPLVRVMSACLKRRGLRPWLDEEQMFAGKSFQAEIQAAIPLVGAATVVVGPAGLGQWQEEEVQLLLDECKQSGKPLFLTLLPGVEEVPPELGFLRQRTLVSFENGTQTAFHDIESTILGKPARPFHDVVLCYSDCDAQEVRTIEDRLRSSEVYPWASGINSDSLQLAVLRQLDEELERIWSLAVVIGSNSLPWEQDIVADIILEFREEQRPVIPIILKSVPGRDPHLPVFLRRLGRVDLRQADPSPFDRLLQGIAGDDALPALLATRG